MIPDEHGAHRKRAHDTPFLDLFGEDGWRVVHAGEREVRPPTAPTNDQSGAVHINPSAAAAI
jgi:hypothetical protein